MERETCNLKPATNILIFSYGDRYFSLIRFFAHMDGYFPTEISNFRSKIRSGLLKPKIFVVAIAIWVIGSII